MTDELMTTAVCWDTDSCVSVHFAYSARELFYFCPDPSCIAKVVPAQITNTFFRAPASHASGCVNEKKTTTQSAVPAAPMTRHSPLPPKFIPTHLGMIAHKRKGSDPNEDDMRDLAKKIQKNPVTQHPGTLSEVVDAWCLMDKNTRSNNPLEIAGKSLNYFSAFGSIKYSAGDIAKLDCDSFILSEKVPVKFFNGSYWAKTWSKFWHGKESLSIRVRIKSDHADFERLEDVEEVELFLHGPIPTVDAQGKYFVMADGDDYSGFIIKF